MLKVQNRQKMELIEGRKNQKLQDFYISSKLEQAE